MINIAKLLKDVPKGMKLYSPLFGEVEYCYIGGTNRRIWVCTKASMRMFSKDGRYCFTHDGNTIESTECLLFPSKDCRTWEGWNLPVQPKFKVGDKVIYGGKERTITFIDDKFYDFDGGCAGCRIELQDELLRPVPKPHYDISNFHVGMPVLVRDGDNKKWLYTIFGMYNKDNKIYPFVVVDMRGYVQCIPFEGNEHLLGTTDMCDEMYINW